MIAIIKNVIEEGPGSIESYLKEKSIPYRIFEAQKDDFPKNIDDYDALIIMGGPMGVYEMDKYPYLVSVAHIIEEAISKDKKVLGICLGAQLIAHVLGSRVYKGYTEEIGWLEIELTDQGLEDQLMLSLAKNPFSGNMDKSFKVFHWHGDTFDLPLNTIHLAKSKLYEHQAFRYGIKVYAFQFHIEVTKNLIETWFEDHPLRDKILKDLELLNNEYSIRAKNFYDKFLKSLDL